MLFLMIATILLMISLIHISNEYSDRDAIMYLLIMLMTYISLSLLPLRICEENFIIVF